ncbi:unnamed protein product [Echinostoma caproni]|uniref:FH2 domain-containing protein n=1 Tax=Echinostoma caproni TaxID=27848 RepID=A0A183AP72_9TREM|nr:unnamed protein product [Echinostoma caproni]
MLRTHLTLIQLCKQSDQALAQTEKHLEQLDHVTQQCANYFCEDVSSGFKLVDCFGTFHTFFDRVTNAEQELAEVRMQKQKNIARAQLLTADPPAPNLGPKPLWKKPPRKSSAPGSKLFPGGNSDLIFQLLKDQNQSVAQSLNNQNTTRLPMSVSSCDLSWHAQKPPPPQPGSSGWNGETRSDNFAPSDLSERKFKFSVPNLAAEMGQNNFKSEQSGLVNGSSVSSTSIILTPVTLSDCTAGLVPVEPMQAPAPIYRTRSRVDMVVTRRKRSDIAAGLLGADRERRLIAGTNQLSISVDYDKVGEDTVDESEQNVIRRLTQRLNRIQDQVYRERPGN